MDHSRIRIALLAKWERERELWKCKEEETSNSGLRLDIGSKVSISSLNSVLGQRRPRQVPIDRGTADTARELVQGSSQAPSRKHDLRFLSICGPRFKSFFKMVKPKFTETISQFVHQALARDLSIEIDCHCNYSRFGP